MSVSSSNTLLADQSSTYGTAMKVGDEICSNGVMTSVQRGGKVINGQLTYLTPSGLHVEHIGCVMLLGDDLSKVHVLVEELRTKADYIHDQINKYK